MEEDKISKIQEFIQKREKLKNSPVINKSKDASIFKDKNPKVKSLPQAPESKTVIKSSTPHITTKEVSKLTPENFKAVQTRLKAGSAVKSKLSKAIKAGDVKATKKIIEQVGEVAKKTGNTELLSKLIKKVAKSPFAKKAGKKLLSAIPLVGGIASAISSGDIKAAVPGLDLIDNIGPKEGSLNHRIETGNLTPEDIELLKRNNHVK